MKKNNYIITYCIITKMNYKIKVSEYYKNRTFESIIYELNKLYKGFYIINIFKEND